MPKAQSTDGKIMLAESGAGKNTTMTKAPEKGIESPADASPGANTEVTSVKGGREDLTVFFSIGLAIDVILVTAFLVWAVGQWRKTKK